MRFFRRRYGSTPLHLAGHLVAFVVAGWAIGQILGGGSAIEWIVWFIGAAILHDLVLLPAYSLADRLVRKVGSRRRPGARHVALANHVRVPAVISGVLLIVYFPVILGLSSGNYRADTGHPLAGYARNWLLITAALCLGSGLVYAIRVYRARPPRPPRRPRRQPRPAPRA